MDTPEMIAEAMEGRETRTYKITALPDQLDEFEKIMSWTQRLGSIGHSASAQLSVDGDGAARIKIERTDGEKLTEPDEDEYNDSSNGPELSIGID